jgi:hypothetical protein
MEDAPSILTDLIGRRFSRFKERPNKREGLTEHRYTDRHCARAQGYLGVAPVLREIAGRMGSYLGSCC